MIRYIDMVARIAAIRTEIAEHGHHPGPDSLTNQDLLALCDEVEDMRALLHGVVRFLAPPHAECVAELETFLDNREVD